MLSIFGVGKTTGWLCSLVAAGLGGVVLVNSSVFSSRSGLPLDYTGACHRCEFCDKYHVIEDNEAGWKCHACGKVPTSERLRYLSEE